ncbi:hypothetical protein LXL04_011757 [Taraxacum kok-saghyz]
MDHSFNDRVDKVFGSISSSSSSTPWSLTDAQVERRVWNRDKADNRDDDDETLVSSSFDNLFNGRRNRRKSLEDISDDDVDVGDDEDVQTENNGDEWDIRSSIGLDSTLDNEEEEDAYDKMAEGRENENGGERVYMKDVSDHGRYLNSHNLLSSSNHAQEAEEGCSGMRIKSILKRKNEDDEVKPAKRVRFDPKCKKDEQVRNSQPQPQPRGVPDYVVNPSKYTRYDLSQSKDVGVEEKACAGDLHLPSSTCSVIFIPRKKRGDDAAAFNQVKQPSTKAIGFAALEVVQEEEEEEAEIRHEMQDCSKKPGRRYRSR